MSENIKMSASLWRQLIHEKPIKFRLPNEDEFLDGTLDAVCHGNGDCYLSIFYLVKNRAIALPEATKLELTQEMVDKIGWSEDRGCFMAVFE